MLLHGSCIARDGRGVLLTGEPGSGKSDLVLRLLDRGFALVADDQVEIEGIRANPPKALAGLLEVRGLGIIRMAYLAAADLALVVALGRGPRLPMPARHGLGLPLVTVDPALASAPERVALALELALGRQQQLAGAFA